MAVHSSCAPETNPKQMELFNIWLCHMSQNYIFKKKTYGFCVIPKNISFWVPRKSTITCCPRPDVLQGRWTHWLCSNIAEISGPNCLMPLSFKKGEVSNDMMWFCTSPNLKSSEIPKKQGSLYDTNPNKGYFEGHIPQNVHTFAIVWYPQKSWVPFNILMAPEKK